MLYIRTNSWQKLRQAGSAQSLQKQDARPGSADSRQQDPDGKQMQKGIKLLQPNMSLCG
jgi:hypothetical protein